MIKFGLFSNYEIHQIYDLRCSSSAMREFPTAFVSTVLSNNYVRMPECQSGANSEHF